MNKQKILTSAGLALVFAIIFLLTAQRPVSAGDCRIVRIVGASFHESVKLEPVDISIAKGTCVIWFNKTPGDKIKIVFEGGKKVCEDVIDASMDFKLDENNCFITATHIPPAGTASLMFPKEGTFDYMIEAATQDKKVKGRIYVR